MASDQAVDLVSQLEEVNTYLEKASSVLWNLKMSKSAWEWEEAHPGMDVTRGADKLQRGIDLTIKHKIGDLIAMVTETGAWSTHINESEAHSKKNDQEMQEMKESEEQEPKSTMDQFIDLFKTLSLFQKKQMLKLLIDNQ